MQEAPLSRVQGSVFLVTAGGRRRRSVPGSGPGGAGVAIVGAVLLVLERIFFISVAHNYYRHVSDGEIRGEMTQGTRQPENRYA